MNRFGQHPQPEMGVEPPSASGGDDVPDSSGTDKQQREEGPSPRESTRDPSSVDGQFSLQYYDQKPKDPKYSKMYTLNDESDSWFTFDFKLSLEVGPSVPVKHSPQFSIPLGAEGLNEGSVEKDLFKIPGVGEVAAGYSPDGSTTIGIYRGGDVNVLGHEVKIAQAGPYVYGTCPSEGRCYDAGFRGQILGFTGKADAGISLGKGALGAAAELMTTINNAIGIPRLY